MTVAQKETGRRLHKCVNGSNPVRPTGQQDSPAAIEAATMVAKAGLNVRQRSKQQENSPGPNAKKKPQEVSREGIPADIVSRALAVSTTASHQSKMQPAPSPKSLADVQEPMASMSEQQATEVIWDGNLVPMSMANGTVKEHRSLMTPQPLEGRTEVRPKTHGGKSLSRHKHHKQVSGPLEVSRNIQRRRTRTMI